MVNKKIGLVTGVFDLIHRGHEQLIRQALGKVDLLYVGVESDERVQQLKGEGRPFYQQRKRQQRLQELFPQIVAVILPKNFGENEVRSAWIKKRGITTLVVVDEDEKIKNKWRLMRELGGGLEVVTGLKTIEGELVSMSQILQKTQSRDFLIFAKDKRLVGKKIER